jgi:hypothetical protein
VRRQRNDRRGRAGCALIATLWTGACALDTRTPPPGLDGRQSLPQGVMSAQEAERVQARVAIGKSSKVDVVSALGKAAAVVSFDSGYEVWVYRIKPPEHKDKQGEGETELVLLFGPSGTLAKTRVRAPAASG